MSSTQRATVPQASYKSYRNFLSQYSKDVKQKPTEILSTKQQSKSVEKKQLQLDNIDQLDQLTSEQIELLDIEVLKKFLQILRKMNQPKVDKNNNPWGDKSPSVDIESSKRNLIESLKAQLKLYHQQ